MATTDSTWRVRHGLVDADVAKIFSELSERDRALLWLAYVEGESHEEMASSLAWDAAASK